MFIQHNISGINSRRILDKKRGKISKTLEKLSSGYRINRAGDDAAGLAISEQMRSLIGGISQAETNTLDGIGLISTAEGAMEEISSMLNRMHQLSIKAANGSYKDEDREVIQLEVDKLKDEIARITDHTEFNGIPILRDGMTPVQSGSAVIYPNTGLPGWVGQSQSFQNGRMTEVKQIQDTQHGGSGNRFYGTLDFSGLTSANKGDLIDKGFHSTCFTCDNHYSVKFTTGTGYNVTTSGRHYIINLGIDDVSDGTALVNKLVTQSGGYLGTTHFTRIQADGAKMLIYDHRIKDTNLSSTSYNNPDRGKIAPGIAVSPGDYVPPKIEKDLQFQIGASEDEILEIVLPRTGLNSLNIENVSLKTQTDAHKATESLVNAINHISDERGRMGGYQNRLEHTKNSLSITRENLTSAESRIRDTDMADEITRFTRDNILLQAAQSMLTQANAIPQNILNLLT